MPYEKVRSEALKLRDKWRQHFRTSRALNYCTASLKRAPRQQMQGSSKGKFAKRVAMPSVKLRLSKLPATVIDYCDGVLPQDMHMCRKMVCFMNAREVVAKRRDLGLVGPSVYACLPAEFADLLKAKVCPNVRRSKDRTTKDFHRLSACMQRYSLCNTVAEREHMKRCIVLNFALWRILGGTLTFALSLGFLCAWDETQRCQVRDKVKQAYETGRIKSFFTAAYQSTAKIRNILGPNADPERIEAVLYDTGPKQAKTATALMYYSVEGKLQILDQVWQVAPRVVKAAALDHTGRSTWQLVANELARVTLFGSDEDGIRKPTFFAKEIAQDLMDTPVFEGGRTCVSDLRTFSPAGPGALKGLMRIYGLESVPTQAEAIPMMRALLDFVEGPDGWQHQDTGPLELHDIQFMLCEIEKFLRGNAHMLRDYTGRVDPDLDLDERILFAEWLTILEEALCLDVAYANHAASDADDDNDDAAVICGVVSWLGLPTVQINSAQLSHGDCVKIKYASCIGVFSISDQYSDGRLSLVPPESHHGSTGFRVERHETAGQIHFGDTIYLRCPSGRHIGRGKNGRVCPLRGLARFEREQSFILEATVETCDDIVTSGANVRLRYQNSTGSHDYVQLKGNDAFIGSVAGCSTTRANTFTIEKDPRNQDRALNIRAALKAAIEEGIARKCFKRDCHGRLFLAARESIRSRLVGSL